MLILKKEINNDEQPTNNKATTNATTYYIILHLHVATYVATYATMHQETTLLYWSTGGHWTPPAQQ
jgi:hypothetical protein